MMRLPLAIRILQQPLPCSFHQQSVRSTLANVVLLHCLDTLSISFVVNHKEAGVPRLGLLSRFQILSQCPLLEDRFEFGNERGDFGLEIGVGLGSFEKTQKALGKRLSAALGWPSSIADRMRVTSDIHFPRRPVVGRRLDCL